MGSGKGGFLLPMSVVVSVDNWDSRYELVLTLSTTVPCKVSREVYNEPCKRNGAQPKQCSLLCCSHGQNNAATVQLKCMLYS